MRFGMLKRGPLMWSGMSAVVVCSTVAIAFVYAQPPGRGNREDGDGGVESSLKKLMAYDTNNDGKLTKDEITDSRLAPLLQRADADNDGVVTKDELKALLTKEAAAALRGERGGPGGPPPDGGFGPPVGGPGGPGGRGPGGRGPGSGPGQVLPMFLQDELGLTEAQRHDVQELQKEVDARLAKILTADQQKQFQDMRSRGPGGPGRGGPGGPGGPGGGPPGGARGGDRDQNDGGRRPQRPE